MHKTGRPVDFMLTARPAIIFVACPVWLAAAICFTGLKLFDVKYSVIITINPVRTSPIRAVVKTPVAVNACLTPAKPRNHFEAPKNAIAASTPETASPL